MRVVGRREGPGPDRSSGRLRGAARSWRRADGSLQDHPADAACGWSRRPADRASTSISAPVLGSLR
ncbi:MAG: hypothetical protein MZV70_46635 [Desulfobacterales bacterium]|nr:hypothetical protein [Desulfobacterales bacterium]